MSEPLMLLVNAKKSKGRMRINGLEGIVFTDLVGGMENSRVYE